MTEHQQLKSICDKIAYKVPYLWYQGSYIISNADMYNEVGVREIIFTPEFMGKYIQYLESRNHNILDNFYIILLKEHLDKPTTYLYNLIEKGE